MGGGGGGVHHERSRSWASGGTVGVDERERKIAGVQPGFGDHTRQQRHLSHLNHLDIHADDSVATTAALDPSVLGPTEAQSALAVGSTTTHSCKGDPGGKHPRRDFGWIRDATVKGLDATVEGLDATSRSWASGARVPLGGIRRRARALVGGILRQGVNQIHRIRGWDAEL